MLSRRELFDRSWRYAAAVAVGLILPSALLPAEAEAAEVVRYVDNRVTGGNNSGTSEANAFRSIEDMRAAIAGQTIDRVVFVVGSGPYREAFGSRTTRYKTDLSFAAADKSLNSTVTDLTTFGFQVGDIVHIYGSPANSRQFTISTIAASKIVFIASNIVTTEAAGAKVMITTISAGSRIAALDPGVNGTASRPLRFQFNGVEIDCGRTLNEANGYTWTASTGKAGEWYVKRSDGSNPSLVQPFCGTMDGIFINDSADLDPDMGTVGSLSTTAPMGWGDNDSLGYSTVYVKSDTNPNDRTIRVGQIAAGVNTNWQYLSFEDGIFTMGTRDVGNNVARGVAISNGSTTQWWIKRCLFKYQSSHAVENSATGITDVYSCLSYFSGHRGYALTVDSTLRVYNCVDYGAHIFALIGSSVTGSGSLTIRNCISAYNEAGAIDKKSAAAVLTEDHNIWWPRFGASGAALGYVSTANWGTTAASDYPPSAATTISTQSANVAAGGVDPLFMSPSLTSVSAADFKLRSSSVGKWSGQHVMFARDFAGQRFSLSNPSRGIYEFGAGDTAGARTAR